MLNKQHLPILRRARDLIDNGEQFHICFAIASAITADAIDLSRECEQHIMAGLQDQPYLTWWVRDQLRGKGHPWWLQESATSHFAERREEAVAMQRMMRMCWLDKLIYDLENPQ
jgi:hypothetical protein